MRARCPHCGELFEKHDMRQVYCSKKCRWAAKYQRRKDYYHDYYARYYAENRRLILRQQAAYRERRRNAG